MRTDTADFIGSNSSLSKEPRFVVAVSFDDANTDLVYFTSHADAPLPASITSYDGILINWSTTSQHLKPEKANASIGSISFDVVDENQTIRALLNTKYDGGNSLKGKRVQAYMNYDGLAWADAALVQTQIIDEITYKDGTYSFKCSDVQRLLRKKIFTLATTTMQSSITATDATVTVYDTSAFEMVAHGTSFSDAPSATVGYVKIEDEVIRYTGKTSTTFTGCVRGVLNTKAVAHEINTGASADRRTEVEEFVYLEMPAPKLAYAILTGDLYGQGSSIPDTWSALVDAAYVRTASFTQIGVDLWDTTDDTKGMVVRFTGEKEQDAKKFIEEQLMLMMGCYMPIHGDGALGMRRMVKVLADAQASKELTVDNLTQYSVLKHSLKEVKNKINIDWNWETTKDDYTRHNLLIDSDSTTLYGASDLLTLSFRGLHGSIHNVKTIEALFERLRDRFVSEPLLITVKGFFSLNDIEIGDVIKLSVAHVQDYVADTTLNRAFEVQRVSIDWFTGAVSLSLFGSTATPAPAVLSDSAEVATSTFYTSTGTNLNTLTGYSSGHLTSNVSITGNASLTNAGAIYYYDGDLTIDAGVTLTISDNIQLRIKGFLTINGDIDGLGNGITTASTSGYTGTSKAQGGINVSKWIGSLIIEAISNGKSPTIGLYNSVPELNLIYNDPILEGLPDDLRGTTGSGGGDVVNGDSATGGAHGNSGAGLAIISQGLGYGASGFINISGADGVQGSIGAKGAASGTGAGGSAGSLLVILDGSSSVATMGSDNLTALRGASTPIAPPFPTVVSAPNPVNTSFYQGFSSDDSWESNHRVQYLPSVVAPEEDIPEDSTDATSVSVTELTNTPVTAGGNLSSLEVTVTPPSDTNYSHSAIYYKVQGNDAWSFAGVANDELVIVVASDGVAYDVEARAVSIWGIENGSSVSTTITTTDVTTPELNEDVPIEDTLEVPDVRGLELFESANSEEFTGKDAKFVWRKSSSTNSYFIGSEPTGMGSNSGGLDLFFLDYEVRVYDGSDNELRIENVTDNFYIYTHEKNVEDYTRVIGSNGANRSFRIEVYARSQQGQYSLNAAKLTATNPAPALPSGISLKANFRTLFLEYTLPTDLDFAGVKVWIDTSTSFTRDATTLVYNGIDTNVIIDVLGTGAGLEPATTYYVYMLAYDAFGETGTESVELSTTTLQVINVDLGDDAVEEAKIKDLAVSTAKIQLLAVGSAQIAALAVGEAKIDDLAVATAKIKDLAVTNLKIGALAVDTAKIASLAVTNAKIANLAVDTLQIANQAVTIPVSAYTSGSVTPTNATWYTVQSATITSAGNPISVIATSNYHLRRSVYEQCSRGVRILRGSTVIYNSGISILAYNAVVLSADIWSAIDGAIISDTPGSGAFTYHLQVYLQANYARTVSGRSIILLETKK